MSKISQLFRVNKLGPLGLIGAVAGVLGIFFPWKIVTGVGFINGTTDTLGWVMALLSALYALILFTNFKWNILLGLAVEIIALYIYFTVRKETRLQPGVEPGIGLYFLLAAGLLMILGTLLLFRSKKEGENL